MDGEFACPECGQIVKVPHHGPGRQVRCGFCNRLLEAPFLPRVEGDWKRARFGRPRWVAWAWWGVAFSAMGLIGLAGVQVLIRGERAARARAIEQLLDSSRDHEAEGRLDLALLDLDSALEAAPATDVPLPAADALRRRRGDLARRDVQAVLARLTERDEAAAKNLGDWLNLVARAGADRDLAPLRQDVEWRFLDVLGKWIDERIQLAKEDHAPSAALAHCEAGADLAIHLPQPHQDAALERLRATAAALVNRRGVVVEAAPGEYVLGTTAGYGRTFDPMAIDALKARGFLPSPTSSRWRDLWNRAPYRFSYAIRERHEGTYLGTQNRLTRIEAGLTFLERGREIWKTVPHCRTIVPVPNLSSYLAGRLALSQDRNDEAEKVLYGNALSQIRSRFAASLNTLPTADARLAGEPG